MEGATIREDTIVPNLLKIGDKFIERRHRRLRDIDRPFHFAITRPIGPKLIL
jgi:hypothetical protein